MPGNKNPKGGARRPGLQGRTVRRPAGKNLLLVVNLIRNGMQ